MGSKFRPVFVVCLLIAGGFYDGCAGFETFFIPHDRPLSKINTTTSRWLASICGRTGWGMIDEKTGIPGRKYPWAVSIMFENKNKLGGAIISPYHILTAAHGFVKFKNFESNPCHVSSYRSPFELEQRIVSIGDDCIRGHVPKMANSPMCNTTRAQYYRIRSVYVDTDFAGQGCQGGHDWAILELTTPIQFQTGHIAPICLPFHQQSIANDLTIFSWGRRDVFLDSDPLIHEIQMAHDPLCKPPWSDTMPTKKRDYICAKSYVPTNPNSARTCHGDSGSGLEQRDSTGRATLVGITSFGTKGCPSNELARFTRVSTYLQEICELTGVCYTLPWAQKKVK
uniref:Peptidase S1 domain-containing protein n=1 Tax=Panagrellus redivivus TaxID=6233 RepID=A0A7E4ZUE9_PANRE